LNVRCHVSSQHSAHLRVIDLCRWGIRRLEDAAPRAGTRAPGSGFIINIKRFLLKYGSLCRDLHPHRQDYLGHLSHDIHHPAPHRGIEFIFIGINL
jgi:hypothetical protein